MTTANLSDRAKRSSPVPTDPQEARALVARATRGDSAAWTEIVQRYGLILHSTAWRYGLSPEEHDDAVQRIWQQAVEHLHTVRDGAALPGWLATSIRRECLAVIRARAREALAGDMAEHDAHTGQPDVRRRRDLKP
jgi:DNA-directed RNA polymerase specialized sigma24 family protein